MHRMESQAAAVVAKLATLNPRSSTLFNTHQSITPKMSTTTTYKDSIDSHIDSHLKQVITIRPPFEVFKPMHHLVFSTPKNIAPALCVAACEAVGGRRSDALPAASALHLMQVAAFAHENLLLGNVNPSFGPNIELLTGDGVLPLGLELLAKSRHSRQHDDNSNKAIDTDDDIDENYAGRVVRVIVEITRAIGSQGVVDAQYKKHASDHSEHDDLCPHVKHLKLKRLKAKNGEFIGRSAACGAILGGGSDECVEMLRRCGMFVGMMNEEVLDGAIEDVIMELRDLAMKELEGLDGGHGRIELISSLVDSVFCVDKYHRVRRVRERSDVL